MYDTGFSLRKKQLLLLQNRYIASNNSTKNSMNTQIRSLYHSTIYSKNSFVRGMFSAFDLRGVSRRHEYGHSAADAEAIYHDWAMVGHDLRSSIQSQRIEYEQSKEKSTNS